MYRSTLQCEGCGVIISNCTDSDKLLRFCFRNGPNNVSSQNLQFGCSNNLTISHLAHATNSLSENCRKKNG